MRRFARWLLNSLAVFSLLLCVATVAIVIVSRRHHGINLVGGLTNGRCWQVRAYGWGPVQLLTTGAWPHGRFSIRKLTGSDEHRIGELEFTVIMGVAGGTHNTQHGWQRLDLYTGQCLPYLSIKPPDDSWRHGRPDPLYKANTPVPFAFIDMPGWALPIPFGLLPSAMLVSLAARRIVTRIRRRRGLCLKCSYDLTANVSGVCPECGAAIATTSN